MKEGAGRRRELTGVRGRLPGRSRSPRGLGPKGGLFGGAHAGQGSRREAAASSAVQERGTAGERGTASALWRWPGLALRALVWLWVVEAVACAFVMTLGTDEAWALNGLRSYLRPFVPHLSSEPVYTSGGPFALANLAVEALLGSEVWAHRLVSLAALLSVVALAARLGRSAGRGVAATAPYLAAAPLLGVPGTAEVGTSALGTSTAVAFLLLGALAWSRPERPGAGRALLAGVLLGLGASARFDLVLFAPALLAASCLGRSADGRLRPRLDGAAALAVAAGVGVWLANWFVMKGAAHPEVLARVNVQEAMEVTGLGGHGVDYPRLLNKLHVALRHAPLGLLALGTAAALWPVDERPGPGAGPERRLSVLLVTIAWTIWLAWMLRAPIPHLRYLWPALALLALPAGGALAAAARRAVEEGRRWRLFTLEVVAAALVAGGVGGTFRSLVMSDADYASWEWSGEMALDYYRRFQAARDQREAAAHLATAIPPDATVAAYVPFALRYLGDRRVLDLGKPGDVAEARGRPVVLVLSPTVGAYLYLRPEAFEWMEGHARLTKQIGRYSFYDVAGGLPEDGPSWSLTRTQYEGHPGSGLWFGRHAPARRGGVEAERGGR